MSETALLISIRPIYAEKILKGMKTVELRRIRPKVSKGDWLVVYVPSPVKELRAILIVDQVISGHPDILWEQVSEKAGISREEFDLYFKGTDVAFAINFKEVWKLVYPIKLSELRKKIPGFTPPQSYHYYPNEDLLPILETPFSL